MHCIKKNRKNHLKIFLINHAELRMRTENVNLCFYKTSTNQTFTFISSTVVYFKKHLAYQVYDP